MFGGNIVGQFNYINNTSLIARAHQVNTNSACEGRVATLQTLPVRGEGSNITNSACGGRVATLQTLPVGGG